MGEFMKCELIEEKADEIFSEYTLGPQFIDFCRGPHVPSTKRIKAFKLLSIAGAYWKGDEKNHRMQRIYGTAFFSPKELEEYLKRLEEAKKRDHRKLGQELDLFSIQDLAGPGLIFFHPKGGIVRKIIEDWMRDQYLARGYSLVYTPHIARSDLWKTSGHYNFYAENMFKRMELDDAEYQLKPMNCPFHILIYRDKQRSYRDLPVRLGELGTVYRYERSGVMHGLLRVRGFTQDDAHIFCTPGADRRRGRELSAVRGRHAEDLRIRRVQRRAFHLGWRRERQVRRHAGSVGARRRSALKNATERLETRRQSDAGRSGVLRPEDRREAGRRDRPPVAAFHGAVRLHAAAAVRARVHRRGRQGASAADGAIARCTARSSASSAFCSSTMPARSRCGSRRCRRSVLPITDRQLEYADQVHERLVAAGIARTLDDRSEKVNLKIREAQLQKVPYMLVVGDREAEEGTVVGSQSQARRSGREAVDDFLADIRKSDRFKGGVGVTRSQGRARNDRI